MVRIQRSFRQGRARRRAELILRQRLGVKARKGPKREWRERTGEYPLDRGKKREDDT